MKRYSTAFLFLFFTLAAFGQHADPFKDRKQLAIYEDSLRAVSHKIFNDENELERYNNNYKFIKTLVSALKTPQSFNYRFDSLKTISILNSPDSRFKIFTWHVMNNDGSYRFYGTIQMNSPSGELKMYPLVDHTEQIQKPADTVTNNEKWYGAQYYKIIPVTHNVRTPYYILLGWKGNNVKTTKKVIEVLHFKDGKAFFGMPVFDGDKERVAAKRVIFEYTRQASMMLNYDQKAGTIVFDHLAPPDPKLKGRYEMYGPDMSYDGFKLVNGRMRFVEDLILKNPASENDSNFNDPRNPRSMVNRNFRE